MTSIFSERYGYVKPQDAVIRECMPKAVVNSLCTLIDKWSNKSDIIIKRSEIEIIVWCYFLNERRNDIYNMNGFQCPVIVPYLQNEKVAWYKKLDMIEFILQTIQNEARAEKYEDVKRKKEFLLQYLQKYINAEFERLHYGYRIVNGLVAPISTEQEITAIEKAIGKNEDTVHKHLNQALQHFANREAPDYRNSIKESISAVEVLCRDLTGEGTLGRALDVLEKRGVHIHPILKSGMHKMYDYTNQPEVGARHGLMDDTTDYSPSYNEAYFMLVTCSAFINYLRGITST